MPDYPQLEQFLPISHGKSYFYIIIFPSFTLAFVFNMKTTFGMNITIFYS